MEACAGLGAQSRGKSLLEAVANTLVGFVVSLVLTAFMFPNLSASQNLWVTSVFTVSSIARGYVMRRVFEKFKG